MARPFGIQQFRVARLLSKVLTRAAALNWRVAPWLAEFRVNEEIPFPGCPDGCQLEPSTGFLIGWDGRVSAYCEHADGSPAGVLVGMWGEPPRFRPGDLGCEVWLWDEERDLVGVMYAPRKLI